MMKHSKTWRRLTACVLGGLMTLASLPFADAMMLKGGDISCYNYVIDRGGVFRDERGRACDGLELLRARGMNFARIRNYVEPGKGHGDGKYYCPAGYLDRADNLALARRAKELGMQIEYSFHYSDYWTNGGVQIPPVAWAKEVAGLDDAAAVDVLEQNVYEYTKETLEQLKAQGTPPEYVSIGNEIQGGMMYLYGRAAKDSWPALARFFNAGARAVREVLPDAKIVLHLDDAGNDYKYETFFDACAANHVDYDIIGCSYYPFYLRKSVEDIAAFCETFGQKYHRPIMVMETGFAWSKTTATGYQGQLYHNGPYDMTKEAQRAFMQDLYDTLGNLKDVEVVGDLYWDPIFLANPGIDGVMNLAAWNESAFEGNLYQDVAVDGGTYTLTCQVMNGGGEESIELYLMDADGNRTTYDLLQVVHRGRKSISKRTCRPASRASASRRKRKPATGSASTM